MSIDAIEAIADLAVVTAVFIALLILLRGIA